MKTNEKPRAVAQAVRGVQKEVARLRFRGPFGPQPFRVLSHEGYKGKVGASSPGLVGLADFGPHSAALKIAGTYERYST